MWQSLNKSSGVWSISALHKNDISLCTLIHTAKNETPKTKQQQATYLHSLRKQQITIVSSQCYLVLFSLSGMLQKELAALDISQSNLISKTPTLAGTGDFLLPDCGC